MKCSDENIIELIQQANQKSDFDAVKCLMKCQDPANAVLVKKHLHDTNERNSIFHHAIAEFFLQVRKQKFILTGEAKICTYLTEIAKRKWLGISKKKNTEISIDLQPGPTTSNELEEKVKYALNTLSASDRDILIAFYYYDHSLEDYATLKKISHAAAKKRISRARNRIKEILKPKVK